MLEAIFGELAFDSFEFGFSAAACSESLVPGPLDSESCFVFLDYFVDREADESACGDELGVCDVFACFAVGVVCQTEGVAMSCGLGLLDFWSFLLFLLDQHEALSYAIRAAKQRMDVDFDSEVSLNGKRQEIAGIFRRMSEIRCCENLLPNAGIGYKFNAEGNQISYRCDLKKVTTINFDRNKVRTLASGLSKKADQVSAALDKQLVIAEVDYAPCFDVNDTFADVFRQYISQNS